ncbi:MAG: SDR family NAD(P)-dependent oxidoreductase [Candidatus Latescibacterota bacterium]|jgi:3-oxoacyl-[acyl-carrier protein] reductase
MDLWLKDKIALITGSSKGIGLRTALGLAQEGCHVAIVARGAEELETAAAQIRAHGVSVSAIQADLTQAEDAARAVATCIEELGSLDILVNNVGGNVGARKFMESTDEEWLATFDLNVHVAVRTTRLAAPHMRGRPGAAVVHISSISGWTEQLAGSGQYGSSKSALIFLTEVMALELAAYGIRVNAVSPGSIIWEGGGWDKARQGQPEAFAAYERDGFPMGRLGHPEEVADVVVFLASSRSNWINGRNIPVDGLEQPVPFK